MIVIEEKEMQEFIENIWDDVYYSDKVQDLLKSYARDVISSTEAVRHIPESYFRGLDIDREGHDLVDIYTENTRCDIGEAVREGLVEKVKILFGGE